MNHKFAVSAELAKAKSMEDEVIDAWKSITEASPGAVHDILKDWYAGKIYLLVPSRVYDKLCDKI